MEPKRWLYEHQSPEVRLALRAGVALMPPPDAERACWTALGAAVAAGGAVASTGAVLAGASVSVKPSALGVGALLKLFGVGAGVGVLVAGGATVVSRLAAPGPAPREPASAVSPPLPTSVEARDSPDAPRHEAPSAVVGRPVERAAPVAPPVRPAPPLAAEPAPVDGPSVASSEESTLVLSAREALRAGDPLEALRMLDRARQSFGRGRLAEERLALEIDALLGAGRTQQAKRMARTFLERYPKSPHAARFHAMP